jgi:hypothetical protein
LRDSAVTPHRSPFSLFCWRNVVVSGSGNLRPNEEVRPRIERSSAGSPPGKIGVHPSVAARPTPHSKDDDWQCLPVHLDAEHARASLGGNHPSLFRQGSGKKKPVPDKGQGLRALKRVLHLSPAQKKPASDKVEHLVRKYLAGLREVDVTFENGAAVVEKYRSKYPELSNHIRRIAPEERRIEITQNLGEDADLRLFVIRILDDNAQYEVTLSKDEEHKTVKSSEWLFLLHDMLARIIAKILYARETSKEESREDVN